VNIHRQSDSGPSTLYYSTTGEGFEVPDALWEYYEKIREQMYAIEDAFDAFERLAARGGQQ
jgi:uncharacterized protein (DUF427 family)